MQSSAVWFKTDLSVLSERQAGHRSGAYFRYVSTGAQILGRNVLFCGRALYGFLGAAANAAAFGAGYAGQLAVSEKSAGAAFFATSSTDFRVEIRAVLSFVGVCGGFAALLCSCHLVNFLPTPLI